MRRLQCLDGLRGALAVYVMLSHMAPFAVLPAWLALLLSHGGAAVDVFFILSGLVIVGSLEGLGWSASPFLIARVSRIFPVYLLVLAVAIAVQPLPIGFADMPWVAADSPARSIWSDGWPKDWVSEILAHLTMSHGLFPTGLLPNAWISFLGAAWSLSTEWQFYLTVLVLGLVLIRRVPASPGPRSRSGPAFFRPLASRPYSVLPPLIFLFLLLGFAGHAWQLVAPPSLLFSRAFLPNKAQYFALGIASAMLVNGGGWRAYATTLASTLALCAWQGGAEKLLPPMAWSLCLAAQLRPDLPGFGSLSRALRTRVMLWLGATSYCLYLANEPIQKLLGLALARIAHGDALLFTVLWLPLAAALPLLAAGWLHHAIEAPALRWGRALAKRTTPERIGSLERAATVPASRVVHPSR
jgi:peptidoglycan/LPS O-acetylase OafA/YrhL